MRTVLPNLTAVKEILMSICNTNISYYMADFYIFSLRLVDVATVRCFICLAVKSILTTITLKFKKKLILHVHISQMHYKSHY